MGFYGDQVLPRALDLAMRGGEFAQVRSRVTAGLDGEVLEIGSGSGLDRPMSGLITGSGLELSHLDTCYLARPLAFSSTLKGAAAKRVAA